MLWAEITWTTGFPVVLTNTAGKAGRGGGGGADNPPGARSWGWGRRTAARRRRWGRNIGWFSFEPRGLISCLWRYSHLEVSTYSEPKRQFEFRIGWYLPPLVKVAPKWMELKILLILFKASEIKCVSILHWFEMWCFPPKEGLQSQWLKASGEWQLRVTTSSTSWQHCELGYNGT